MGEEAWKNKRFYMGLRPGASLHLYETEGGAYSGGSAKNNASFDFAAQFAVQFNRFIAVQTEVMASADSAGVSRSEQETDGSGAVLYTYDTLYAFNSRSLLIPLLIKPTIRPGIYSFSLFGGIYFSVPLGKMDYSDSFSGDKGSSAVGPELGWEVGGSAGIKVGPGVLFADLRFLKDFDATKIQSGGKIIEVYKRAMAAFSLGYEIGSMNIKK
jgi:hypothetical protein